MYPIYNLEGINDIESTIEGKHVIGLLLVKPSDQNADSILKLLNYWHCKSSDYCSIYLLGYSEGFSYQYEDIVQISGIRNATWEYSDECFLDVCNKLRKRLNKWQYSGEPEMIILQNMETGTCNKLDFRGYCYIDINYGINNGYIDSFPRFMERFLNASKVEVEAVDAIKRANRSRVKCRNVLEKTIESAPKLSGPIKRILKDKLLYKSFNNS